MEGNQMKMREACKAALSELYKFGQVHDGRIHLSDIVHVANARGELQEALSAPPRQCDVGTAEEQAERFKREMCYNLPLCRPWDECCLRCFAKWDQMPYGAEEGRAQ